MSVVDKVRGDKQPLGNSRSVDVGREVVEVTMACKA